jgi:hypothetical protein
MLLTWIIAAILVALGLALTFVGYRYFLLLLPLWGFVIGFWAGAAGASQVSGGEFMVTTVSLAIGFVIGVVCGITAYFFYLFGIYILSAVLAYWLVVAVLLKIGMQPGFPVYFLGLVAAVLGVYAMFRFPLQKGVIIVLSAFLGAVTLVTGALLLFGQIALPDLQLGFLRPILEQEVVWMVIWLGLMIAGAIFQFVTTKGFTLRSIKE